MTIDAPSNGVIGGSSITISTITTTTTTSGSRDVEIGPVAKLAADELAQWKAADNDAMFESISLIMTQAKRGPTPLRVVVKRR